MQEFARESPLGRLLSGPMRPGKIVWIGLRPARKAPMLSPHTVSLVAARGIEGDRYRTATNGGRQVTLVAQEDLTAIASFLGYDQVSPERIRRNFLTRGINLLALKGCCFRLGTAVLEYSGECHPCSRMEEILGSGGYNAVRGHGGITARVLEGGIAKLGDEITRTEP